MKCIIDTNVLISASLFPDSVPAAAFFKAAALPNVAVVCDYSVDELHRTYNRKFPSKLRALDMFLTILLRTVKIIDTPPEIEAATAEMCIRDIKDRPILRAALKSDADILITGDRDFLESGITKPRIITPADFMKT
jgi:putative PIN family toxin of toxin-antitoxin system